MFDRLRSSLAIRRYRWQASPCPACGGSEGERLLARDRYLLRVDVTQCAGCGLVYTARNLAGADMAAFYRDDYRHFYEDVERVSPAYVYETRDRLKAAYRLARIVEQAGEIEGVVEVGSGLGFFIRECAQRGVARAIGFEPGRLFAEYAIRELGLAGRIVNADCFSYRGELPEANVYAMFHVLEHLPDPGGMLDWIAQRIGGGWLVIEVPDIAQGWDRLGLRNFHFGHRAYFSAESLGKLLHRHGFGVCAFQADADDGIYPGNLRVFARRQDAAGARFLAVPTVDHADIRRRVRSAGEGGWRNSRLRCAARLLRP